MKHRVFFSLFLVRSFFAIGVAVFSVAAVQPPLPTEEVRLIRSLESEVSARSRPGVETIPSTETKGTRMVSVSQENGAITSDDGRIRVVFGKSLAQREAIKVSSGEETFTSAPLAIYLHDVSSHKWVLVGRVRGAAPAHGDDGKIIYRDVFDGLRADVIYTHARNGFEQDIVIRSALPSPMAYGLSHSSTVVEVVTEFSTHPELRAQVKPPGNGVDVANELNFGALRMPVGKVFAAENRRGGLGIFADAQALPVRKEWLKDGNRQILVESVSYVDLAGLLKLEEEKPVLTPNLLVMNARQLPVPGEGRMRELTLLSAPEQSLIAGVVIDYALVSGDYTNYTFRADTTYYVTNTVSFYGKTTIEGGTVIKFNNTTNAEALVFFDEVVWPESPYRPAVFTARDDNSIGENAPGSTGNPSGYYADYAIYYLSTNVIRNARVSFAESGIYFINAAQTNEVENVQFFKCGWAVNGNSSSEMKGRNLLLNQVNTGFRLSEYRARIEHLTINGASNLFERVNFGTNTDPVMYLTNSLVVAVTNFSTNYLTGLSNAVVTEATGVFSAVGSGYHYLPTNSAYLNAGSANISATMSTILAKQTTLAPLQITNKITSDTVLRRMIATDTNTPDLGYHYPPLDYFAVTLTVTNATLALNDGVRVGLAGQSGLWLTDGSVFHSMGKPHRRNILMDAAFLHEQPITNGNRLTILVNPYQYGNGSAPFTARFTDFVGPNNGFTFASMANNFRLHPFLVTDAGFYIGKIQLWETDLMLASYSISNSFFNRAYTHFGGSLVSHWSQNTFFGSTLRMTATGTNYYYTHFNNLIVESILQGGSGNENGYNAYYQCGGFISTLAPTNATEIVFTNLTFQTGPLGNFYINQTNVIINAGSTYAATLGLKHYTTATNQTIEDSSLVDIGAHYVAVDGNGNPLDSDGDGLPDYVEDGDGNGFVNGNETNPYVVDSDYDGIADGMEDSDNDGLSNQMEYDNGTNPYDASSGYALRLSSWNFENGTFSSDQGQAPAYLRNVVWESTWSGKGAKFGAGTNPLSVLNIDPSYGDVSGKMGAAAYGYSNADFWNGHNINTYGWTYGVNSNLVWADGSSSKVTMITSNIGGFWPSSMGDSMYSGFMYSHAGASHIMGVYFTNLPPHTYDFYVYAHGSGGSNENTTIELVSGGQNYGELTTGTNAGWDTTNWVNGKQYVLFTNVVVTNGNVKLIAKPHSHVASFVNGIQIVPKGGSHLQYGLIQTNGYRTINPAQGTLRLWYKPDWSSTNLGGAGPGNEIQLLGVGNPLSEATNSNPNYYYVVTATNSYGEGLRSLLATTNSPTNSISAVKVGGDASTQGSWKGVYGNLGHVIVGDSTNLPTYVNIGLSHLSSWIYTNGTTNLKALQKADPATNRIAAIAYDFGPFTFDVQITNTGIYEVAFYVLDWENFGVDWQTIELLDPVSGQVLGSHTLTNLDNGQYSVWNVRGTARFRFKSAFIPLLSGIFIGDADTNSLPPEIPQGVAKGESGGLPSVTWNSVPDAFGYVVKRATATNGPFYTVGTTSGTNFVDGNLPQGWWGLTINSNGNQLMLSAESGGQFTNYLSVPIALSSNNWYEFAITYDQSSSAAYVNTVLITNGVGVSHYPNDIAAVQTGVLIGGAIITNRSARGTLDRIDTFNYRLSGAEIISDYSVNATYDNDYDGRRDGDEVFAGTDPLNAASVDGVRLGYWRFNSLTFAGEDGQFPFSTNYLYASNTWSGAGVAVPHASGILRYPELRNDNSPNINLRNGSVRFWFKPNWTSDTLGGSGPGTWGRLLEMGRISDDYTYGDWQMAVTPGGGVVWLSGQSDGVAQGYLSSSIQLESNKWHQFVITYTPSNSALYVDGALKTTGPGITRYPGPAVRADGFTVGNELGGYHEVKGVYDELETFNYPLSAGQISSNYVAVSTFDTDGDGLSDQLEQFHGTNPSVTDTDYDGRSDGQEIIDGTNPLSATSVLPVRLGYWRFNTNSLAGELGELPIQTNSISLPTNGLGKAVYVQDYGSTFSYREAETNGKANVNVRNGSIRFWFQPKWTSESAGGTGPDYWSRVINVGGWSSDASYGLFNLGLYPSGDVLYLQVQASGQEYSGIGASNSFISNNWYQIVVTYTPTNSAIYIDGVLKVTGGGLTNYPSANARTNGLNIGNEFTGWQPSKAVFDELETFNYPLAAIDIASAYSASDADDDRLTYAQELELGTDPMNADSDGDGLIDGYEDFDGDLLLNYQEYICLKNPRNKFTLAGPHTDYEVDNDNDGLINGYEVQVTLSNPNNANHYSPSAMDSDYLWTSSQGGSELVHLSIVTTPIGSGSPTGVRITLANLAPGTAHDIYLLDFSTFPIGRSLFRAGEIDQTQFDILFSELPSGGLIAFVSGSSSDADGDGLSNAFERLVSFTSPTLADTDGDGLDDKWEHDDANYDPKDATDGLADTDGDGLSNAYELTISLTDPSIANATQTMASKAVAKCPVP